MFYINYEEFKGGLKKPVEIKESGFILTMRNLKLRYMSLPCAQPTFYINYEEFKVNVAHSPLRPCEVLY